MNKLGGEKWMVGSPVNEDVCVFTGCDWSSLLVELARPLTYVLGTSTA